MSRFSILYPYFIIVSCLITCVLGITSLVRMPVDLFPAIRIPVVVVATFYSGMPAEDIETSITSRFERFFTLGSGIDHIESRSLPGVSLIKVYFQPGSNPDTDVSMISNLAMANLRHLPEGTFPPVVLKFDASSLPVCLITLKAEGLNETQLRDLGQFNIRNQVAGVPGASVPPPFGGKYRQIMVYVDPLKLEANQLSVMDVVRAVNNSNLILPAGDVKIGPYDYNVFSNSQIDTMSELNQVPLKTVGNSWVTVADVGYAKDAAAIQTNVVRIDGQPSVYLPVLKQGGDSNTIIIVDGIKKAIANLLDVPKNLVTKVVFDQSVFVKNAIDNLVHEGAIGLILTGLMILIFLGNLRATAAVFFSIPLSVCAVFLILSFVDNSINAMILGGLALAFSRVIDNSVVVLENIYRHLEMGESPQVAAEIGGREVELPVLASTITTAIVFFPVTFLYGVSKFLFSALALAVVISLFASYVIAMTVVPLFCAKFLHKHEYNPAKKTFGSRFNHWFNHQFERMLLTYDHWVAKAIARPRLTLMSFLVAFILSPFLFTFIGFSYFPRTDPGQFVINLKAPTGTRVEDTSSEVEKLEDIIRRIVSKNELNEIISNIGVTPGFSAIYTSNTGSHSAFVQVSLKEGHKTGSYVYMDRARSEVQKELPELVTYFQSGGLVDAVLNQGLPAPIDIQVGGAHYQKDFLIAKDLAIKIRGMEGVSDVFIPQDVNAPSYKLDIDRIHASEMGISQKEVVDNVITALTSNAMVAPSYWIDPKTGFDYFLTVQYPEKNIQSLDDLKAIPIRGNDIKKPTRLDMLANVKSMTAPTVVDHYQLRRVIDIYVAPKSEDLSRVASKVDNLIKNTKLPEDVRINLHGSVLAMRISLKVFGLGLLLSLVLVYLVLVAQFQSFVDPFIILLAVLPGLAGVPITLLLTNTTLNVMSLMGIVMLMGIASSNSILIVEFTHRIKEKEPDLKKAVCIACRVRLRPVLMTSLATIIGLIPMSLALGAGSETYASLARVIIGGLTLSVLLTVFIVPMAYLLIYGNEGSNNHKIRPALGET
jgi:hydrophobic/amphiphilic exporter-1 (mainly G- bacteria), HAE1 family